LPIADRRLAQFIKVVTPVLNRKEDPAPPIAPVDDVVRDTWNDSACESSHAFMDNPYIIIYQHLFITTCLVV
jgi:hypothetical protein